VPDFLRREQDGIACLEVDFLYEVLWRRYLRKTSLAGAPTFDLQLSPGKVCGVTKEGRKEGKKGNYDRWKAGMKERRKEGRKGGGKGGRKGCYDRWMEGRKARPHHHNTGHIAPILVVEECWW
jgi:hypothetical protein